jgi:hypothetical protein
MEDQEPETSPFQPIPSDIHEGMGSVCFVHRTLELLQAQDTLLKSYQQRIYNLEAATVGLRDQVVNLQERMRDTERVTVRYQRCR